MASENFMKELRELVAREIQTLKELAKISGQPTGTEQDKMEMIQRQKNSLKESLNRTIDKIYNTMSDMTVTRPLPKYQDVSLKKTEDYVEKPKKKKYLELNKPKKTPYKSLGIEISDIEKRVLKKIRKQKKVKIKEKKKKASKYIGLANRVFGETARKISDKKIFVSLKHDLIKSNLEIVPNSYIAMMLFTSMIAVVAGFILFILLMFFSIGLDYPFVKTVEEGMSGRFLKVFWIIFGAPLLTFVGLYVYPSSEKNYIKNKIDQELPFATINMSAIAGSMVEPSKIFSILISTKDYPFLQRELTKIINQINVYGYDLVTALRNVASNNPSQKLTELLNGLATTINSGGSLIDFFEKRGQTLLFEYRIEREKYTKTAETFMDIYISVVIAAPMILMLLLIMMNLTGLGISISNATITLVMILGVSLINVIFLVFLQAKQPSV